MVARNITLSLPDDLVRRAKVLAAQRDTSVSAIVRDALSQLTGSVTDYDTEWAAEEERMTKGVGLQIGSIAWTRDSLHDR